MSQSRFVILAGDNRFNFNMASASLDLFRTVRRGGMASAVAHVAPGLRTIDRIGNDEALLVSLDDTERLLLQRAYPGVRLVAEGTARMARMSFVFQPIQTRSMASAVRGRREWTIRVLGSDGSRLSGAPVIVLTDESVDPPVGVQTKTGKKGEAKVILPASSRPRRVIAMPESRYWWSSQRVTEALSRRRTVDIVCKPIDLAVGDGLRALHKEGVATDGQGVTVAVIDGGASHASLRIAGGENLVDAVNPSDWSDNGLGHGTHVAGICAAQPGGKGPAGLAPGVRLLIYRVYAKGSDRTGSFAVAAAIRKAVDAGADLINLSLTLEGDVTVVERELKRARAMGALCVAAAGNSAGPVCFPACFPAVAAVSAVGVRNGWPPEAHGHDVLRSPRAKGHPKVGVAAFTCFGPEIDFTASGVGVVSLWPRNTYAVQSGTSMASPAIVGLLARRLATAPQVLTAARDQARSDAILSLAAAAATSVGLPPQYEGHGIL